MDELLKPSITLKVIGYQWFWGYELNDKNINIDYNCYTINEEDLKLGELRLLDTDNRIILPINNNIRILITSDDVIHSWAIPSLAIKLDAIPGRLNQCFINILRESVYFGQCSELCGKAHHSMSIVLEAVNKKEYLSYLISNSSINTKNLIILSKSIKDFIY